MACKKCGTCCYAGFYDSRSVAEGIIKIKPYDLIEFLASKNIKIDYYTDNYSSIIQKIKPYELKSTIMPYPCLFLNNEHKCAIHPSILGSDIRGTVCKMPACIKLKTLT